MKHAMLETLMKVIVLFLDEENMKKFADYLLDFVENGVEKSSNKWDDAVVLPLCKKVREAFDIPDND